MGIKVVYFSFLSFSSLRSHANHQVEEWKKDCGGPSKGTYSPGLKHFHYGNPTPANGLEHGPNAVVEPTYYESPLADEFGILSLE